MLCFFQSAQKFRTSYAMLGFSDAANLDKGAMWPTYFGLAEIDEAQIRVLIKKAAHQEGHELR